MSGMGVIRGWLGVGFGVVLEWIFLLFFCMDIFFVVAFFWG
jgi:hypothetical protein